MTVSKGTTQQPQQHLRPGSFLYNVSGSRGSRGSGSTAHAECTDQQTAAATAKLMGLTSFSYTGRSVYGVLGQNASDPFKGLTTMTNLTQLQLEDDTPASIGSLPRFVPHLQLAVDVTEPLMERLTSFLLLSPPDPLDFSCFHGLKDLELVVWTRPSVRVYEGVAVHLPSQLTCLELSGPVDDVYIATASRHTSVTVSGSGSVAERQPAAANAAAAAAEEKRLDEGVLPALSMLNILGGKVPVTCISKLIRSAPQLQALHLDGFTESQSYAWHRFHGSMTDSDSVSSSGEYGDLNPMLLWPAQAQQLTASVAAVSGLRSLYIQGFELRSDPHLSVVQWGQCVKQLTGLQDLQFNVTFDGHDIMALTCLTRLTRLKLDECGDKVGDDAFVALCGALRSLRELSISDSGMFDGHVVFAAVAQLTELRALRLAGNHFLLFEPGDLQLLKRLQSDTFSELWLPPCAADVCSDSVLRDFAKAMAPAVIKGEGCVVFSG